VNQQNRCTLIRFKGDASLSYKQLTGLNYRTIINTTALNICAHLAGEKNTFVKWIIDLIWNELPTEYLHPCPYIVSFLIHFGEIDLHDTVF
jgi:hypothetical protein